MVYVTKMADAGRVYKKVSNDAHTQPCTNSNPNPNPNPSLGRVPCLVCLYMRPAVCIVTMNENLHFPDMTRR